MSLIRKNIIANFAGSIWQTLLSLIFIPLYIKFIGIESWGLIGIFGTIQVMFGLLDMGLSGTINREMARLSALPDKGQEMRNLVRTLEVLYWGIAVLVAVIILSLSPVIAHHWINGSKLSSQTVEQALLIMGFVVALQMPIGFYKGGMTGLQKQVLLNITNMVMSTLRGAGAVFILWRVSQTIQAYFLWQIIISVINNIVLALLLWRILPFSKERAVFQKRLLKGIWKFAAGMSGITILSVILTQIDKVILSKMLSLENFGYYTLASMIALSLVRLITPVFSSIYPRFTQLVSINAEKELTLLYHKASQFASVLLLPFAIIIALFAYEIILIWTHDSIIAEKSHRILSIMICGSAINGIMYLPYALQLANGWTNLSVLKNIIAVIIIVPLIIYLTIHYGAIGAAIAWFILNIGLFFIEIPVMHHRLLINEKWQWYWKDVCIPLMACMVIAGFARIFISGSFNQFVMPFYIFFIFLLMLLATIITTPTTRTWSLEQIMKIKISLQVK